MERKEAAGEGAAGPEDIASNPESELQPVQLNPVKKIIVEDGDACKRFCKSCKQAALRYKVNEGTLVCTECGEVQESGIIDMAKESRIYGIKDAPGQVLDRCGDYMRIDQINDLHTELRGGRGAYNVSSGGIEKQRQDKNKKSEQYYRNYFLGMMKIFKFKQRAFDMAMEKAKMVIEAKNHDVPLQGKKVAFAVNILHLVANELSLNLKLGRIAKESGRPTLSSLQNAAKQLRNVFKEWFRHNKKPEEQISKCCAQLGYPPHLTEDAQYIAAQISKTGDLEGCQPMTICGVALYVLNQRLAEKDKAYKKYDNEIAAVVEKCFQTIKDKHKERIEHQEMNIVPEHLLTEAERQYKLKSQADLLHQQQQQQQAQIMHSGYH